MVFRFVDDFDFHFPDTKSSKILIHVKSAFRVGCPDLGMNRK